MSALPTLGVLITYYNEGPLLTECLDTLLSGPEKPDEILIYDDASSNPAENHVKAHHPVRIIRGKENIGIGRARNELMKASQCDFIHFQDADDLFGPGWCEKVRKAIGGGDVDVILHNTSVINIHTRKAYRARLYSLEKLEEAGDLLSFFLAGRFYILVAIVTFRRQRGLEAGGYVPREILDVGEDGEFHMRLFARCVGYRVLDEPLVLKSKRPNTLSYDHEAKLRREIFVARVKVWQLLLKWLPSTYYPRVIVHLLCDGKLLYPFGEVEYAKHAFRLAVGLGLANGGHTRLNAGRPRIARLLYRHGVLLFRAGEIRDARVAFQLLRRYGQAKYGSQTKMYRGVLKLFGPEFAERCLYLYGRVFPSRVRAFIREKLI